MSDNSQGARSGNGRSPFVILGGITLIGLALALIFFGNGLFGKPEGASAPLQQIPSFGSSPGADGVPGGPIQIGEAARDFVLNDLAGNPVHLSDFNGRPVILNFWATWCGPCRIEMPDLQAVYDTYQADGLIILAINREESASTVQSFFHDEMGLTFTPLLDADADVARLYSVANYPTSIFIDREGRVTAVHLGLMVEEQIEKYLIDIINKS